MGQLDQNLVTSQWGVVGIFGVAVPLLIPRARELGDRFTDTGHVRDFTVAFRWWAIVMVVPLVGAVTAAALGLVGVATTSGLLWADMVLLAMPSVVQGVLEAMALLLVPRPHRVRNVQLEPAPQVLPASPMSLESGTIQFVNESDEPLLVWWIDTGGRLYEKSGVRSPQSVPVHGEASQSSYVGHTFLITTDDEVHVGIARTLQAPTRVSIDQSAVAAARTQSNP